jgi:hypothetical protein
MANAFHLPTAPQIRSWTDPDAYVILGQLTDLESAPHAPITLNQALINLSASALILLSTSMQSNFSVCNALSTQSGHQSKRGACANPGPISERRTTNVSNAMTTHSPLRIWQVAYVPITKYTTQTEICAFLAPQTRFARQINYGACATLATIMWITDASLSARTTKCIREQHAFVFQAATWRMGTASPAPTI